MDRIPILYVNSTPELGGANIQLINIIKRLDLDKYRPIVVNPPQRVYRTADFKQFGERVITLRLGIIKRSYNPLKALKFLIESVSGVWQIYGLMKKERIRIVHSNSSTVISGAIAAKLAGTPSVWHIHEVITPKLLRAALCRLVLALSDRVVAISNTVREQFPPNAQARVEVIYDGIDLSEFKLPAAETSASTRKRLGLPENVPVVGMVGRFVPRKGQRPFIKACARVSEEFPEARFVLAGQTFDELRSYTEGLKRLANGLGIGHKTHFDYWCDDLYALMSALDIFVHAYEKPEGFGLVVIEAMAMGKPVIGTIGGVREIITGDVGLVVPPRDPLALSDAIKSLLADRKRAHLMGLRGRDRVAEYFTVDRTAKRIEAVYQELLHQEKMSVPLRRESQ